jgi:hypothetical protein
LKKLIVVIAALTCLASGRSRANESQNASLAGVWQTVEIAIAGSNPRTISIPEPRPYLTIITARHYSRTEVQSASPRPIITDVAKATADELRATWGPFVGEAGTYEVSGNMITMHPLVSKSPAAMAPGAFIVCSYKLDGNTLWLVQERNQSGPYPNPATFKAVRVE